jgi:glycolate oxidase iron-sulfur subunit
MSDLLPIFQLDPRAGNQALSCVHCGLCLPVCPTYLETGLEAEGPRGRIHLMRALGEGEIKPTEAVRKHLDSCLDCRACETACPSDVVYHELLEETRIQLRQSTGKKSGDRVLRGVLFHLLPYPNRLKLALIVARIARSVGIDRLLPRRLRRLQEMLPADGPIWPTGLPARISAGGVGAIIAELQRLGPRDRRRAPRRTCVGFFSSCVGSAIFSEVNRKAVELLAASGVDVIVPPAQNCCGALHHHDGNVRSARESARKNIDAFLPKTHSAGVRIRGVRQADYIVTAVGGCGAMLREYDVLLRDDPAYANRAKEFVRRVRDISELLAILPLPPMRNRVNATATYHDACHLVHGQGIAEAPRKLLEKVPGLKLAPLSESDLCCGAAGTYNLLQPKMADELANRKLDCVAATGATILVAGNAGCSLHLSARARERGETIRVMHPVEIVHRAVFGSH